MCYKQIQVNVLRKNGKWKTNKEVAVVKEGKTVIQIFEQTMDSASSVLVVLLVSNIRSETVGC